ncbi:MAG: circadian clock protein KaiC [Syntrophales bacterium]|jgi:circadian clock protein KaiC|nr:circadian clock protein KaiC [Syntrophales bacterium]MDY0043739.1 circadian clock protein KaiC [Syntrophales bacterium]
MVRVNTKVKPEPEKFPAQLEKSMSGITGLDEITGGGLPKGRATLICGGPGSGKMLFGMEFLFRGATQFDEPGVFMAFEETAEELTGNVASLGFDLEKVAGEGKLLIDHVRVERNEIEETGEYDLEGLFIRLGYAIDSIGAKRVVLDTIESLFSGLSNTGVIRVELRRLFHWLKDKGMTTIITGEQGSGSLTREGLEEYVSDCVIFLDHRVSNQISTRRLRIVKYRGSTHGTNEFPFLIDEDGIRVLPITSLGLKHAVSDERISTGISRLDGMLGGSGYYRGSTILVSGTAGTGKTSIAGHFADASCRRGEKALFFAFEESPAQIVRNLRSIGIDLKPWLDKDLLFIHAERPTLYGLEAHLAVLHKVIQKSNPSIVIIDPISNLTAVGSQSEIKSMLIRIIDQLKSYNITTLCTSLTTHDRSLETTEVGISSLADTWLLLRDIESAGERNRGIYVLKSRGMAHSNQIREFLLTDHGIDLLDVYVGPAGVLTGSARLSSEEQERSNILLRQQEIERRKSRLERRRKKLETQIESLRAEFKAEEEELKSYMEQEDIRTVTINRQRKAMAEIRKADTD